jgi:hypothetical protein
MAAYQIAQWLNLLAIALMISGGGFAVSVMLRESGRKDAESPTTPPIDAMSIRGGPTGRPSGVA